ncbi:MAG TPA: PepSY domain-containing protein [Nitrospirota bacterium]|nr:PepSY domain-containing protein [Nitrospirota bacterium]
MVDEDMMRTSSFIAALSVALVLLAAANSPAEPAGDPPRDCPRPYGGYCKGPRWGWYGAKNPVATVDEARQRLEKFFQGQAVTVGPVTEHPLYFKADITDGKKALVDRVIIDKRTGRIRSIL